jgi:hypothetical protein
MYICLSNNVQKKGTVPYSRKRFSGMSVILEYLVPVGDYNFQINPSESESVEPQHFGGAVGKKDHFLNIFVFTK